MSGPHRGCRRLHLAHVNLMRLETDSPQATTGSGVGLKWADTVTPGEENAGSSVSVNGGEADEPFSGAGADSKASLAAVEDDEGDDYQYRAGSASKARSSPNSTDTSSDIQDISAVVSAEVVGEYTSGVKRG